MFENLQVLKLATGMSKHAARQQAVVSQNLANIDTPGYRGKQIRKFEPSILNGSESQRFHQTREKHLSLPEHLQFGNIDSPDEIITKPNGNSVSLEMETLKSIEAERMHSRAIAIYQSSLNILRSSIGKG